MAKTIALELRADDAEPILLEAAYEAAKYGAYCDHVTRRTYNAPMGYREGFDEARKRWQERFLKAKRIVDAFGIEYEQASEAETLSVHVPMKNEKRRLVNVAGIRMAHVEGGEPDYKNAIPSCRREVHSQACKEAAARTVRKWKLSLEAERLAA